METNLIDFVICPNCGSTDYLADYPTMGQITCTKCGHESTKMKLKTEVTSEEMSHYCPFCGKEWKDDDMFLDNDDVRVLKCKKCGKLDGYKYANDPDDSYCYGLDYDDQSFSRLQAKIAKQEGAYISSASTNRNIARELNRRENDRHEKCKKLLNLLVNEKSQMMKTKGITEKTMTEAKQQAISFMESQKPLTEKQLVSLFSAATMTAQERLLRRGHIPKKETTERQLENIFGASRKTVRKWKRILEENFKHVKLGVSTRKKENQRIHLVIELPKEIKSITKLDTPHKDDCDFCGTTEFLTWRINYFNNSWSDVCTYSYQWLRDMSLDKNWEIEKRVL